MEIMRDGELRVPATHQLAAVLNRMLLRDPAKRFPTADAVLDALKQSKAKYIFLLSDQQTVDE